MWFPCLLRHPVLYDPYSAYMHMTYTTAPMNMSATQTAASMLPPPPPPPGEGPPEGMQMFILA